MIEMLRRGVVPAVITYQTRLAKAVNAKSKAGVDSATEKKLLNRVSGLMSRMDDMLESLEGSVSCAAEIIDWLETAKFYRNEVFAGMTRLRDIADELETLMDKDLWPYPTYGEILYSV